MTSLKKLNRQVVKKTSVKPALTDKQARACVAQLHADGLISKESVTAIESTLRQSRRVNAKYEKGHVHTGAEPEENYVEAPRVAKEQTKRGETADRHSGAIGAAQSAELATMEKGSARESFGDGIGSENTIDSENVEASAAAGPLPNVGPRFKQTEKAAAGQVAAASERDRMYYKLAWDAFEQTHPREAEEINKVWTRATTRTLALEERNPDSAFAIMADSWLKKNVRANGRALRAGLLAQMWKDWRNYLKTWRREHPEARLPEVSSRAIPDVAARSDLRQGIAAVLRAVKVGAAVHVPGSADLPEEDRLVADWEAHGMPIGRWGILHVKPLEEMIREAVRNVWMIDDRPLAAHYAENKARWDFRTLHRRYRPRSLLDGH